MALKRLTTNEMIHISSSWLRAEDPVHELLQGQPVLSGLLPTLAEAHAKLCVVVSEEVGQRFAELSDQAAELDATHDLLFRALFGSLQALEQIHPEGAAVQELRGRIAPAGMAHTTKSYREQAGHCIAVRNQLTTEDWKLLGQLKFGATTLRDVTDRWLVAGTSLGAVETDRARLIQPEAVARTTRHAGRLAWIRVTNAIIANASLAELSEEDDYLLFNELRMMERAADERAQRQRVELSDGQSPDATSEPSSGAVNGARNGSDLDPEGGTLGSLPPALPSHT